MRIFALLLLIITMVNAGESKVQFFGYNSNGDKPTVGILLDYEQGVLAGGSLMILSPEYPKDKSSQVCKFVNLVNEKSNLTVSYFMNNGGKIALATEVYEIKMVGDEVILSAHGVQYRLSKTQQ